VNAIRTAATVERERQSGGVGGLGRGQNPLDSFFPFDPYLLRRSYSFIDPYYIHWCGVAGKSGVCTSDETANTLDDESAVPCEPQDDDDSHESGADDSTVEDEDDDSTAVTQDEHDGSDEEDSRFGSNDVQPMSFVAAASSSMQLHPGSPDVAAKREELRSAWTDSLKRSRAPSIENGSW
jgi:RNA polymerase I-specific transcription initiation factor RRN3